MKSFSQIIYLEQISLDGTITESILKDILLFLSLPKLKYLSIINSFRKQFIDDNFHGIDLPSFVNFCVEEGIPDFETILQYNSQQYPCP